METITFGAEAQELRRDVESFLSPSARELFRRRLLPYQRCYMLYGPPGNGKSSILQALSIKFGLKLYFLKVTKTTTKSELAAYLSDQGTSRNCMICIEDAESAFESDEVLEREEAKRKAELAAARAATASSGGGGSGAADGGAGGGGGMGGNDYHPSGGGGGGFGGGGFGGGGFGGGGFGGGGPFGGVPFPASGGSRTQSVTAKVFVDMIRGDGATPPDKRLVFFSTNHVGKMALELKELVDQQGSRTCFPNSDRMMAGSMFEMFFTEPLEGNEKVVAASRDTFLKNLGNAAWFTGWKTSNVSGASLSEYFQRHRERPKVAANCVSGVGTEYLQTIVEDGPEYVSPDLVGKDLDVAGDKGSDETTADVVLRKSKRAKGKAKAKGKAGAKANNDENGTPAAAAAADNGAKEDIWAAEQANATSAVDHSGGSGGTSATSDDDAAPASSPRLSRPLQFGVDLSGTPLRICFGLFCGYFLFAIEHAIQTHPAAMGSLCFAAAGVRLLPVGTWKKVVSCLLVAVLCTVDCDGDGNVWVLDAQDDTNLCAEQFFDELQRHTYYLQYVQPRIGAMLTEAWSSMPMAICMSIFIALWLLADILVLYVSSFLWVRFEVSGVSKLNTYIYKAMQTQNIEQAARLEADAPDDVPEHQHVRKLWAVNHDSQSIAADRYRTLVAELPAQEWFRMSHKLDAIVLPPAATAKRRQRTEAGAGLFGSPLLAGDDGSNSGGDVGGSPLSEITVWIKNLMSKKEIQARSAHKQNLMAQGYREEHGINNETKTEYRVWRWGSEWWSFAHSKGTRDIFFDFIQKHYVDSKIAALRASPTVAMCEYPFNSSGSGSGGGLFGAGRGRGRGGHRKITRAMAPGQSVNVPIGGMSSFVWPGQEGRGGRGRGRGRGRGGGAGRAGGLRNRKVDGGGQLSGSHDLGEDSSALLEGTTTGTLQNLLGLFEDAVRFQSVANKRWYMKRGIPFRRGYFIHGPPKCGKTHFVKLLSRHLGATLHVVDLRDSALTDSQLINMYQGYVGQDQYGGSNQSQAATPYSIVLFKGIEDAVQYVNQCFCFHRESAREH